MKTDHSSVQYAYVYILRIIAAFFVIFNHSGDYGFFLYACYAVNSIQFWVCLVFSVLCKVSVPLFFIISGALLLNRPDEPLKKLWGNRIVKIVIPLVAFSLVYYFYSLYWSGAVFNVKEFLITLYASEWMYHMWYMYAYLAFLICIPFLRSMVQNLSDKYFYYMIVLALIFGGVLPCVEYVLGHGGVTINAYLRPAWLLTNSVLYPSVGYFLQNRLDRVFNGKKLLLLWGGNIVGLVITCCMTYYMASVTGLVQKTEHFHGCFVLLNGITLFCSAKYLFSRFNVQKTVVLKIIKSISDCTFGIYLMHLLLKDRLFLARAVVYMYSNGINRLLVGFIYCALIFMISYVITWVISKIPLLRKIVGM